MTNLFSKIIHDIAIEKAWNKYKLPPSFFNFNAELTDLEQALLVLAITTPGQSGTCSLANFGPEYCLVPTCPITPLRDAIANLNERTREVESPLTFNFLYYKETDRGEIQFTDSYNNFNRNNSLSS